MTNRPSQIAFQTAIKISSFVTYSEGMTVNGVARIIDEAIRDQLHETFIRLQQAQTKAILDILNWPPKVGDLTKGG